MIAFACETKTGVHKEDNSVYFGYILRDVHNICMCFAKALLSMYCVYVLSMYCGPTSDGKFCICLFPRRAGGGGVHTACMHS